MKTLIKKHFGINTIGKMVAMFQAEGKTCAIVDCKEFDFTATAVSQLLATVPDVIILDNLQRVSEAETFIQQRFAVFMDNIYLEVVGVHTVCDRSVLIPEVKAKFDRTNVYFYKKQECSILTA